MNDLFLRYFPLAATVLCLAGLLLLALRIRRLARDLSSHRNEDDPLPGIVAGLKWEINALAGRVTNLETEAREFSPQATIRGGMNLNKRTQALRQYRLGQASGEIAKSLGMPKAEVDLLLKVHRLISG